MSLSDGTAWEREYGLGVERSEPLTWREVFCTSHNKWWGSIESAREGARAAGYNYFAFSGQVFRVSTLEALGVSTNNLNEWREF